MSSPRFLDRPGEPRILFRVDAAKGQPRGRVLLVHGYAEHSARYQRVVDSWTDRDLSVARLDLRGHGESEGPRGHVGNVAEYVSDVTSLLGELDRDPTWKAPGKPVLFGHSMGGLVACHVALGQQDRFAGVALTSPFFAVAKPVPAIQVALGKIVGRFAPRLRQPSGLRGTDCTHDSEIAAAYDRDPLGFKHVTVGWFLAIASAQQALFEQAPTLKTPLFCIAAGDDRLVAVEATKRFFAVAGSSEKELDVRAGLFHEVLNELDWRDHATRLAERMLRWLPT